MIDWSAVQGVVAVLALLVNIAVAMSLVVSIKALRQAELTKESAIFIWALERIREIRPTMNTIRDCGANPDWLKDKHDQVMKVLEIMQMISFMAEEGIIERQRIFSMWGKSIAEQWVLLEPFVRDFRSQIGEPQRIEEGAYFARSFEAFALYCRAELDRQFNVTWPSIKNKAKETTG